MPQWNKHGAGEENNTEMERWCCFLYLWGSRMVCQMQCDI